MSAVLELSKTGIRKTRVKARSAAGDLRWRDLPTEYTGKGQIRMKVVEETRL
jgi:hypothetical protein